ncbi:MAG: DUF3653 domain-containing protein [Pseudomonadota bacterium]|nr:DUF3653 domain-containing protein [Pseudomonadota bacterium]
MDSDLDWISHQALEELTGAHRTTVRRWKRLAPTGWLPVWLRRLVNTVYRGRLDEIHPDWRGWRVNTKYGELVTPEGLSVTQGQIRALPQLYELRRALEGELQQLRREALTPRSPARRSPCLSRRSDRGRRSPAESSSDGARARSTR